LASEPAYFAIRQNRFKSVSDLGPVLAVVHREQHDNPAIFAFWAYVPSVEEAVGKIGGCVAFERMDGDNGKLRVRFAVQFLT